MALKVVVCTDMVLTEASYRLDTASVVSMALQDLT
jgi:hypothetical protein